MTEKEHPSSESDTVVFRPSGGGRWFALFMGIAGVVVGTAVVREDPAVAICVMAVLGLIALAAAIQFWPKAAYLKITPKGFEVRNLRMHFFVPWADVDEFSVRRVGKSKRVVFRLTQSSSLKQRRSAITRWLVPDDIDGALPCPYGGFTLEELASRLNLWRQNALHSDGQGPC